MSKIKAILLTLILAVALVPLGARLATADDPGAGQNENQICFSQSVTSGTTALVATAVSARAHNVRAIVITNTASGFVRLYSTSANSNGANAIGTFGVIANTPLALTAENLRNGLVSRVGEGIYVDAATGTLSLQLSVRQDLKSPKQ